MMGDVPLRLTGAPLSIDEVVSVARGFRPVRIGDAAGGAIDAARAVVENAVRGGEPTYGVNTGFGSLARVRIQPDQLRDVQRNLIRSHAAGVGEPLPEDAVRAMMLLQAASLSRGRSGIRRIVIERICDLLNHRITPRVPSRGSVGASGDLAPLAHAALVLIGEGDVITDGGAQTASAALKSAGLEPVELAAKEGLALINGTHLMAGMGALILADVELLSDAALAAAALAIDACRATDTFLDPRIHAARGQPGQQRVAESLRTMLKGSAILTAHQENDPRVQDPYCLRAAPQVIGAAFDAIDFTRDVFQREFGAVTDNPLVFPSSSAKAAGKHSRGDDGVEADDGAPTPSGSSSKTHQTRLPETRQTRLPGTGDILSGGNFHGMPLAIAFDTLAIALCHIAGIAERRINWLLTASDSENPVNVYLSPQPGLHSGMMIAQYTAAACCNEMHTLATPASVGNIPTSAGMEDYNSMGVTAAHQARQSVDLAMHVIAIELLVMAEAMEYQRPLRSGAGVERIYEAVRVIVPRLMEDRPPSPDIAKIVERIRAGAFSPPVRTSTHSRKKKPTD